MLERMKIVEFDEWCKKCKHYDKGENEDPCWDCLCDPVKVASHKPTRFEEGESHEDDAGRC